MYSSDEKKYYFRLNLFFESLRMMLCCVIFVLMSTFQHGTAIGIGCVKLKIKLFRLIVNQVSLAFQTTYQTTFIRNCASKNPVLKIYPNSSATINRNCEFVSNVCMESKTFTSKLVRKFEYFGRFIFMYFLVWNRSDER